MNDATKAAFFIMGTLIVGVILGSMIDVVLPWERSIGMLVTMIVFFASAGFYPQWYLTKEEWRQNTGFADVHFYLKRRHFITGTIGRWFTPPGIATKLADMYRCGGRYMWKSGSIHLNLPVIAAMSQKDRELIDGVDSDTVDEAVEFVIEHEAVHSAIHSCSGEIYLEVRDQFRSRFRQAGLLGKIRIFLASTPYHSSIGGNEEWAVETLQRRVRAIQKETK